MINKTKIYFKDNKKTIGNFTVRFCFLIIAILIMAFAQSLFNYTSRVGMAPIDAFIKSLGYIFGWEYVYMNYIIIFLLVFTALLFSQKNKLIITATSFITGFTLGFIVQFFSNNVISLFPHLYHNSDIYDFDNWGWGVLYFFIGYFCLTISIGIWINVGFALRPYECLLIRIYERFPKANWAIMRNLFDLIFIILALVFSGISLLTVHKGDSFVNVLTIGVGTIGIMMVTGYVIKLWVIVFKFIDNNFPLKNIETTIEEE